MCGRIVRTSIIPVIIPNDKQDIWLNPDIHEKDVLLPLLKTFPSEEMDYYMVSTLVNTPRNNSPECIKPV